MKITKTESNFTFFEKRVSYKEALEDYFNSPAELDAEAFANAIEYEIFGECSLGNDGYAMGDEEVIDTPSEMMDTIELDKDIMFRIKAVLGFVE